MSLNGLWRIIRTAPPINQWSMGVNLTAAILSFASLYVPAGHRIMFAVWPMLGVGAILNGVIWRRSRRARTPGET